MHFIILSCQHSQIKSVAVRIESVSTILREDQSGRFMVPMHSKKRGIGKSVRKMSTQITLLNVPCSYHEPNHKSAWLIAVCKHIFKYFPVQTSHSVNK